MSSSSTLRTRRRRIEWQKTGLTVWQKRANKSLAKFWNDLIEKRLTK